MGIALIVKLNVREGKGPEFEAVFAEQAKAVRENEPGNRLYSLVRSQSDPLKYAVMELYDDDAAVQAHMAAPYMAANRPRMGPLVGEGTEFDRYDVVV